MTINEWLKDGFQFAGSQRESSIIYNFPLESKVHFLGGSNLEVVATVIPIALISTH